MRGTSNRTRTIYQRRLRSRVECDNKQFATPMEQRIYDDESVKCSLSDSTQSLERKFLWNDLSAVLPSSHSQDQMLLVRTGR